MRVALLVLAIASVSAFALVGCGGDDSATSDTVSAQRTEELLGPEIVPPKGPPPKQVEFKDVKVGSGPVAKKGDLAGINWITYYYETGDVLERWWITREPVEYVVGSSHYRRAFEKGIAGMKEGGQREIIEPGRFVSNGRPEIHLVQLTSLEPAGR
ncbi:MAG TPA: FKBP-type peptidyl-prolyl cis-trans isomerase [Solirubrobacterales bacterium]